MTKFTTLILVSSTLVMTSVALSGCKKSLTTLPIEPVETAPAIKTAPTSVPSIPIVNPANFLITNLKIDDGAMLMLKIFDTNQQLIAQSKLLPYSPQDLSVTAAGDVVLEFVFDAAGASRLTAYQKQKIVKVLYEVVPDSAGRPVETEISRQ